MAKLCSTDLKYALEEKNYWDGEEQIEIVRSILEFYEKNRLSFNHIFKETYSPSLNILPLLVCNKNYHHDGHLKAYLKLLSETVEY